MESSLLRNATVRKAIDVCTCSVVKMVILIPPKLRKNRKKHGLKELWDEDLEKKAMSVIIEKNYEPKERVMGHIHSIARRMLTWAIYHESVIDIPRKYTSDLLQPSVFTSLGLIDSKKIVEHLMTDTQKLTTEQRYRLACMYCLKEHIATLHREMSLESRKVCYEMENPEKIRPLEMVILWSRSFVGEIDSLRKNQSLSEYRLERAVESANLTAVEYCLNTVHSAGYKKALLFAATKAVRNKLIGASRTPHKESTSVVNLESEALLHNLYDYYNDILYLLLSKMSSEDQRNFLRMDIIGKFYGKKLAKRGISRVLQCFLHWPYQAYFMPLVRKMWDFLPKKFFADILLNMCEQLESKKGDTHYGEDRAYDYRTLIKEFWCESDVRFKRCVFQMEQGRAKKVLVTLYFLRNITLSDRDNIKMIFSSATVEEKRQIIRSNEGMSICCRLIKNGHLQVLDELVYIVYQGKEEANEFRRFFISTDDSILLFLRFLKLEQIASAQALMNWARLPEEEELRFKNDLITSNNGMVVCIDSLIYMTRKGQADRICRWCFASDEDISNFKQQLISSEYGMRICATLVTKCKFDQLDSFVKWCLDEEVDIVEFKRRLAYEKSDFILVGLITNMGSETLDDRFSTTRWEQVEKFLTWCFSIEDEISYFKREKRFDETMREIHLHFIKSEQWTEAEKFFLWLEMSAEDVQQLKESTLFNYRPCLTYFTELSFGKESEEVLIKKKKDDVYNFLVWFLKDEGTARAFQEVLQDFCDDNKCVGTFEALDLLIEEFISEMKELKGMKRKLETSAASKKSRQQEKTILNVLCSLLYAVLDI